MHFAQLSLVARNNNEFSLAVSHAKLALGYEEQAAALLPLDPASEPTRSILYKSAASLAMQSYELKSAERFIHIALSGFPTQSVERELKDLLEQITFKEHLESRGYSLDENNIRLSFAGSAVGFGSINFNEFLRRAKSSDALIERTTQRVLGRTFQAGGKVKPAYKPFQHTITTEPGSFAMIFTLLIEKGQMQFYSPSEVIDKIIQGVELINESDEESLNELIPDPKYKANFLALVRDLAPDGENIKSVGFSSSKRATSLTILRPNINTIIEKHNQANFNKEFVKIYGLLDSATRHRNEIVLIIDERTTKKIKISASLDDVVKLYWGQEVWVSGFDNGTIIDLTDIQPGD